MNKVDFLTALHRDFEALEQALADLDETQMQQPTVYNGLAVKDVLAHIAAWENQAIDWVEGSLRGENVVRFAPGFEVTDEDNEEVMDRLNDHFFHQFKNRPLPDVLQDFKRAHERMANLLERLPEDMLTRPGQFDWWPHGPVWQILAANSFEHYQEHLELIRAWQQR